MIDKTFINRRVKHGPVIDRMRSIGKWFDRHELVVVAIISVIAGIVGWLIAPYIFH